MKCKFCESKELKEWWPTANTGAYTCTNRDCTDEEYIKSKGKGRTLQYPHQDDEEKEGKGERNGGVVQYYDTLDGCL